MATNNFKAFALDPNANVMSQADWEALPALLSGFTAGKASSAQINKAIRQATTIAALVGQFIANSGADALDNADVNGLVTKFTNALIANLGLGEGSVLPVGVPVPWPSATPPTGWLKCNGAPFTASQYPKLALAYPALRLPDLRGEFIRGWDDGRGIDNGRSLLSAQLDALQNIYGSIEVSDNTGIVGGVRASSGAFTMVNNTGNVPVWSGTAVSGERYSNANFSAANVARTAQETRPRNIAFNYIVRAA